MTEAEAKTERWKPILGAEDCYEVSDQGRVRSLDRIVKSRGGFRTVHGRILSTMPNGRGYLWVSLSVYGMYRKVRVHHLVANQFLPAPSSELQLNHKDLDKTNNAVSNLEWITQKDNVRHAWAAGACRPWNKRQ